jgi:hypothetical protein
MSVGVGADAVLGADPGLAVGVAVFDALGEVGAGLVDVAFAGACSVGGVCAGAEVVTVVVAVAVIAVGPVSAAATLAGATDAVATTTVAPIARR